MKKIKQYFVNHRELYAGLGVGICIAGSTYFIMRQCSNCSISRDVIVTAKRSLAVPGKTSVNALEVNRGGLVLGNSYALNNVSFLSSNRQGPPSWVVRCIETGHIFTSQNAAAEAMEITASNISRHLNGLQATAQGYTFERICLAA